MEAFNYNQPTSGYEGHLQGMANHETSGWWQFQCQVTTPSVSGGRGVTAPSDGRRLNTPRINMGRQLTKSYGHLQSWWKAVHFGICLCHHIPRLLPNPSPGAASRTCRNQSATKICPARLFSLIFCRFIRIPDASQLTDGSGPYYYNNPTPETSCDRWRWKCGPSFTFLFLQVLR